MDYLRLGAAALLAAAIGACGGDDRRGGGGADAGGSDGGSGGDGGGGTDSGGSGSDAGSPPAGTLVFDASDIFDGSLWLSGTVTLPETSTGSAIQINVAGDPDDGFPGNQLGLLGMTSGATIDYAVTGLAPGIYNVQIRVDTNGDGMVGGSGDWEGWYAGTVAMPITDRAAATPIEVRTAPVTGADFGIGALP